MLYFPWQTVETQFIAPICATSISPDTIKSTLFDWALFRYPVAYERKKGLYEQRVSLHVKIQDLIDLYERLPEKMYQQWH